MESFSVGDCGKNHNQSFGHDFTDGSNESLSWKEVFDSFDTSSGVEFQREHLYTMDGNVSITKNLMTSFISHI
jgi:hypothetical protein